MGPCFRQCALSRRLGKRETLQVPEALEDDGFLHIDVTTKVADLACAALDIAAVVARETAPRQRWVVIGASRREIYPDGAEAHCIETRVEVGSVLSQRPVVDHHGATQIAPQLVVAEVGHPRHEVLKAWTAVDRDLVQGWAERLVSQAEGRVARGADVLPKDGRPGFVAHGAAAGGLEVPRIRPLGAWVKAARRGCTGKPSFDRAQELIALRPMTARHEHLRRGTHVRGVQQLVRHEGLGLSFDFFDSPRRVPWHDDVRAHAAQLGEHGLGGGRLLFGVGFVAAAPHDRVVRVLAPGEEDPIDLAGLGERSALLDAAINEAKVSAINQRGEDARLHAVGARHDRIRLVNNDRVESAERVNDVVKDFRVASPQHSCHRRRRVHGVVLHRLATTAAHDQLESGPVAHELLPWTASSDAHSPSAVWPRHSPATRRRTASLLQRLQ
mmetsp:Transcript_55718/g.169545  ORF Transcript_55718/g.169545 Transcript_55718/m.169545 type:complete len:442 (+) Transcript_55718:223-1548(+)